MHMWYTGTLLTGIHYGTGQRTADISVADSVAAMRVGHNCLEYLNNHSDMPDSAGGSAS